MLFHNTLDFTFTHLNLFLTWMRFFCYQMHFSLNFSLFSRVSVSRAIKPFSEPGRPPDWFSQKVRKLQTSITFSPVVFWADNSAELCKMGLRITNILSVSQHCASQYSELLEATEAPKSVLYRRRHAPVCRIIIIIMCRHFVWRG